MKKRSWNQEEFRKEFQEELERLEQLPAPLLSWYDSSRRILPWRETPSPYRVWISEIMLQQTRVEAGKAYFERFMEVLPNVFALANVSDQQLMKLWEGLGYYSRARNLKKAAGVVMERFGGEIPGSYEELLKLPGIGPYTAGAVSSIAFGRKAPAVDGNVLRVLSRILASEKDIADGATKREMEGLVLSVMPEARPGDFNQALMELGAMVCLPNGAPKCVEDGTACPAAGFCRARLEDRWAELPVKKVKKERRIEEKTVLILLMPNGEKAALQKRPDKGLLAGLHELPNVEGFLTPEQVKAILADWGLSTVEVRELPEAKHIFSHVEWRMKGYRIRLAEETAAAQREFGRSPLSLATEAQGLVWISQKELAEDYALPSAFGAFREQIWKSGEGICRNN